MSNLLSLATIFFAGLLIYHFRARIIGPMKRFEARNAARRAEELRARFDKEAHYRQTIALAEEQIEPIEKIEVLDERTGEPVTRYLYDGVQYAAHSDAAEVRYQAVIAKAREFYIELDKTYLSRRRFRAAAISDGRSENVPPRR